MVKMLFELDEKKSRNAANIPLNKYMIILTRYLH